VELWHQHYSWSCKRLLETHCTPFQRKIVISTWYVLKNLWNARKRVSNLQQLQQLQITFLHLLHQIAQSIFLNDRPVSTGSNTYNYGIGDQLGGLIVTSDRKPDWNDTNISRVAARGKRYIWYSSSRHKQKKPSFYRQKQCPANILWTAKISNFGFKKISYQYIPHTMTLLFNFIMYFAGLLMSSDWRRMFEIVSCFNVCSGCAPLIVWFSRRDVLVRCVSAALRWPQPRRTNLPTLWYAACYLNASS